MAESRAIQRRVLAQLGRLSKLRDITLGLHTYDCESECLIDWQQAYTDDEPDPQFEMGFNAEYERELGTQYQCLSMSLQDGLDELKGLKCLRKLTLERMSLKMGEAEQAWMAENWPEYGKEFYDAFWTSRGHCVGLSEDYELDDFRRELRMYGVQDCEDWW